MNAQLESSTSTDTHSPTGSFVWTREQERVAELIRAAGRAPGPALVRIRTRRRSGATTVVAALAAELGVDEHSYLRTKYLDIVLLPSNGTTVIVGTPSSGDCEHDVVYASDDERTESETRSSQFRVSMLNAMLAEINRT